MRKYGKDEKDNHRRNTDNKCYDSFPVCCSCVRIFKMMGRNGKLFERKISQKERVVNYDCELVFTPLQLN